MSHFYLHISFALPYISLIANIANFVYLGENSIERVFLFVAATMLQIDSKWIIYFCTFHCPSYVSWIYTSHFSYACKMWWVSTQPCVGKLRISLVLFNFWIVILDYGLKLHKLSIHTLVTRNTLNHCLKFTLHSISCHICYGKISEKIFNTVIKDKLLVSKASNSCFKDLDFFQMLLASQR